MSGSTRPPPGTAPASAPITFGNFVVESRIGRGGMAEVFLARFRVGPRQGRKVALKRLLPTYSQNPEYVDLFCSEADLSRMLQHPNVIEVLEIGSVGDNYYMALEFIDGRDLGQVLARCRERRIQLPVDFGVFLAQKLLEALAYAHDARSPSGKPLNIVHCDVSPSNLFVSRVGEIKLGDFGIAKIRSVDPDKRDRVWGKPQYASPELIRGEDVEPQADLWAAAITLFELLTLERPFDGPDVDAVAERVLAGKPPALRALRPEVSPALSQILVRALDPRPERRFPDAASFATALGPHYDDRIGNPMAIAAVVRGLFGA